MFQLRHKAVNRATFQTLNSKKVLSIPVFFTQKLLWIIFFEVATKKTMPEYGSYELLMNNPCSSAQYKMNGPFTVISRDGQYALSLIHISEPTRLRRISYAVFCLKKKKK